MSRWISYTEVSTALDCAARWDFRYGGWLAGSSLREKAVAPQLSAGRAWGAGVAAWHSNVTDPTSGNMALDALDRSLTADADRQREQGLHDQEAHDKLRERLLGMLAHYIETTDPIPMHSLERELLVSIPSRSGQRASSRYRFLGYVDAIEDDEAGIWLDEFKLRNRLTSASLIANSRQIRWYAWAYWRQTGNQPSGVWVNERLNEVPKPPRVLKGGKPSHAKDQLCTAESYEAICREFGEQPKPETLEALAARKWQQRVPVMFRDGELEAAGRELVSAAKLIRMLDSGDLEPLRNVKRSNCEWCPFREICEVPEPALVDALFDRMPPKRERDGMKASR